MQVRTKITCHNKNLWSHKRFSKQILKICIQPVKKYAFFLNPLGDPDKVEKYIYLIEAGIKFKNMQFRNYSFPRKL